MIIVHIAYVLSSLFYLVSKCQCAIVQKKILFLKLRFVSDFAHVQGEICGQGGTASEKINFLQ